MVFHFGSDVAMGRDGTTVVIKDGASEISHKYHKWMGKSSMVEFFFGVLCAENTGLLDFFGGRFIRQPRTNLKSWDLSSRCMQWWWYSLLYVHIYRTLIWIE